MPFIGPAPWRLQYFENSGCPADVFIPTDDPECWELYPDLHWLHDKINIARSQGLRCGSHDQEPDTFPVFSKPRINLQGMGLGSRVIQSREDFRQHRTSGHMWMQLLTGDHISTDCAVIDGKIHWIRHAHGIPWTRGMFKHWIIESKQLIDLQNYLQTWIQQNLPHHTGMLNFETIGGKIIEAHARFTDQWCDLYGKGWVQAVIGLYRSGMWRFDDSGRRDGYSVPLFASHGTMPRTPTLAAQSEIRAMPEVSSLQITFHEHKPGHEHPMPPGGFRLGIINCWDLQTGQEARRKLATSFPDVDVMLP